jgi:hypothetical protein
MYEAKTVKSTYQAELKHLTDFQNFTMERTSALESYFTKAGKIDQ